MSYQNSPKIYPSISNNIVNFYLYITRGGNPKITGTVIYILLFINNIFLY